MTAYFVRGIPRMPSRVTSHPGEHPFAGQTIRGREPSRRVHNPLRVVRFAVRSTLGLAPCHPGSARWPVPRSRFQAFDIPCGFHPLSWLSFTALLAEITWRVHSHVSRLSCLRPTETTSRASDSPGRIDFRRAETKGRFSRELPVTTIQGPEP